MISSIRFLLWRTMGTRPHTVEGPADNIKVTTQRDFFAFKGVC